MRRRPSKFRKVVQIGPPCPKPTDTGVAGPNRPTPALRRRPKFPNQEPAARAASSRGSRSSMRRPQIATSSKPGFAVANRPTPAAPTQTDRHRRFAAGPNYQIGRPQLAPRDRTARGRACVGPISHRRPNLASPSKTDRHRRRRRKPTDTGAAPPAQIAKSGARGSRREVVSRDRALASVAQAFFTPMREMGRGNNWAAAHTQLETRN